MTALRIFGPMLVNDGALAFQSGFMQFSRRCVDCECRGWQRSNEICLLGQTDGKRRDFSIVSLFGINWLGVIGIFFLELVKIKQRFYGNGRKIVTIQRAWQRTVVMNGALKALTSALMQIYLLPLAGMAT